VSIPLVLMLVGLLTGLTGCAKVRRPSRGIQSGQAPRPLPVDKVILISVDTLRSDCLGCYNPAITTTPVIDGLADQGILFENAHCNFPLTTPSHVTMFSGLYSWSHGIRGNSGQISERVVLLAEILEDHGWRNGGFISLRTLDARFGFNRGFDVYDDHKPLHLENAHFNERRGRDTVEQALAWMKQHLDQNVFLFLHLADPHGPYTPPDEFVKDLPQPSTDATLDFSQIHGPVDAIPKYQRIGDHDEVDFYVQRYHAEIEYVDSCLQLLLDRLRKWRILDNSLIVFTSDHGEALGEHNRWFQHGTSLYSVQTQVPLVFCYPGAIPARVGGLAETVDITPTILDLLRIEAPVAMQGETLVPRFTNSDLPGKLGWYGDLHHQRAIEKNGMKFIAVTEDEFLLFDTVEDPGETRDIAPEASELLRELDEELLETIRNFRIFDPALPAEEDEKDKDLQEALRALGYIE